VGLIGDIFAPLAYLISGELNFFHDLGAPWWLAIVCLTVSVRSVLFPLTLHQVKSVRALQELKPEMEKIRNKYKDDRQRQQEKLAELYRERQVNPLGGCLPVLVQMPIFITLYYTIRDFETHVPGFESGGFLWFTDLTRADPYFVLPALFAGTMLAAQELASRNVAPRQRRIMRLMPIAIATFLSRFPAALLIYYVTSSSITLLQNLLIYRSPRETERAPEEQRSAGDRTQTRPKAGKSRRGKQHKKKRR
jgi:YidC/Oxa1 family membrane protein insertase